MVPAKTIPHGSHHPMALESALLRKFCWLRCVCVCRSVRLLASMARLSSSKEASIAPLIAANVVGLSSLTLRGS